jgi:hypothetical protein
MCQNNNMISLIIKTKCLFLGYDEQHKRHRMYNLSTKKILLSCDVVFKESKIGYD